MSLQENYRFFSPEYKLGRIDAINEVLLRIKVAPSDDYSPSREEIIGIIDDYYQELIGKNK